MDRTSTIYRVISGQATPAEVRQIEKWIAENDSNRIEFEDIKLFYANAGAAETDDRSDFGDLMPQINRLIRSKKEQIKKKRTLLIIFLSITGLVMFLAFYYSINRHTHLVKFENTPLQEVITTLEGEYDIQITTASDYLLQCRFSGSFYNQPAVEVIPCIASALNLKVSTTDEHNFFLTGEGCQ